MFCGMEDYMFCEIKFEQQDRMFCGTEEVVSFSALSVSLCLFVSKFFHMYTNDN